MIDPILITHRTRVAFPSVTCASASGSSLALSPALENAWDETCCTIRKYHKRVLLDLPRLITAACANHHPAEGRPFTPDEVRRRVVTATQVFLAWVEEQRARRGMISFGVDLLQELLGTQNEFIFRELMRKEGLHLLRERVVGALEQALRERTTAVLESIGKARRTKDAHGEWPVRGREQHPEGKVDRGSPSETRCNDQSHEGAASPRAGSVKMAILAAFDASSARLFLASGRNGAAAGRVDHGSVDSIGKATRQDQACPGSRQMYSTAAASDAASMKRVHEEDETWNYVYWGIRSYEICILERISGITTLRITRHNNPEIGPGVAQVLHEALKENMKLFNVLLSEAWIQRPRATFDVGVMSDLLRILNETIQNQLLAMMGNQRHGFALAASLQHVLNELAGSTYATLKAEVWEAKPVDKVVGIYPLDEEGETVDSSAAGGDASSLIDAPDAEDLGELTAEEIEFVMDLAEAPESVGIDFISQQHGLAAWGGRG